jgi:Flp pilus assembly protein TadD
VAAANSGDWPAYMRDVQGLAAPGAPGPPLVVTLLEAWGQAGRGDIDGALGLLDPDSSSAMSRSYFQEHRAHILAFARRWPEAADAYGTLVAGEAANVPRLRVQAAGALLQAGRARPAEAAQYRARAIAMLGGGPTDDPLLQEARAQIAASPRLDGRALGGQVMAPTDGLAQLFLRLSVEAQRERGLPVAVPFARFSTFLAPALPETWLVTADALARQQLWDLSLAALARVPPGPYRRRAEARTAQVLAGAGRTDDARQMLQALATSPQATPEDWVRLSDLEREEGNSTASAAALDKAIAMLPADAPPGNAYIWFLRGSAHEQAGNWPAAEPDLRRAVTLQPENPVFLNYLGYSLLDRGLALDEADALIARAFKAAPDNGAIIDSMGWSAYVRGNYAQAVDLLEQARAAEPSDPTVADHLGDALWRVGRRIEARHAWASALTLEPSEAMAARLKRKIDYGLDIALATR